MSSDPFGSPPPRPKMGDARDDTFAPGTTGAKPGRGCFFYGCLTASILLVVGLVAVGVALYYGWRYFINTAKEYTETAPATLPAATMPAPERKALHERVEEFREGLDKGTATGPIVLTADDLNALIDDNAKLKGKVHVAIDGDRIKARVSLPLAEVDIQELKGRYLNGSATVRASLIDGKLDLRIDDIEAKGRPLPDALVQAVRDQNLAEKMMEDPDAQGALAKLDRIVVKDGTIVLTPKADKSQDAPDATEKSDPPAAPPGGAAGEPRTDP